MGKENTAVKHLLSTSSIVLVIVIWQIFAIRINNHYLMPHPYQVFKDFFHLFVEKQTYIVLGSTFVRLLLSISVSAVLGLVLGLLSGIKYQLEAFLKPIIITLRTLPVISIIVIILILLGNTHSLYIISFLLLFPLIYQAELDGVKNINKTLLEVLRMDCDKCSVGSIKMVYFPLSLPYFRTSLLQSAGLGIKVLVVAEFIAQTKNSIGWEIYFHRINLEYSLVFAWTIVLVIIVTGIEHVVNRLIR
jgi:ABC-type nitrate/sulfonate/bicarbonate transport system permease component